MPKTGLGQGGYLLVQKETAYNVATVSSLVTIPLESGTIGYELEKIVKKNQVGSRIPQKPQSGRGKVGASDIVVQLAPDLFGQLMNLCCGAATTGSVSDEAYPHAWLVPITGESVGVSWTGRQAIGGDLASQFNGLKCIKWILKCGNDGIMTLTMTMVGVDLNDDDVARATTFAVSSADYYTFANAIATITPDGEGAITQPFNSWELMCDYGYLEGGQRFQAGSSVAVTPIFGTIPIVEFKGNIDAERRYEDWAVGLKDFALDIALTSSEIIGGGSTPYSADIEIPVAQLKSPTKRESGNDHLCMDLDFEVYGGVTTGSGSDAVQMEVRVADGTATYTGY